MNPQEKQQVAARDDKWAPFFERVKISFTNIRLETTVPQKEETFQVVFDIIKNSTCFKAFFIFADVPKIFMQQFWYPSRRTILDICPKVKGVDFTDVPDDDTALTFLINLGYKGPLYKHTNMFLDHMHQPWRTLAAITNKCLSGKTISNDKLKKSRIKILWRMFKRENVDYPKLIWEDIAYQINHKKEKRSRCKNMPYPRFTKISINHFLKQHKSLTNINYQHYHTIKDDGIVSRLKFVRIGKDYQEYGLPIPETMLSDAIKQSKSYQMFIKYSIESQPEPEPDRKKISSKRMVKKKVTLSADDNIIFDDLDAGLDLAKSISKTKAEEAEAARKVHARIVTEHVLESAIRRKSGKVTSDPLKMVKGVPYLTPEEQEAVDIMQALKERDEQDNEYSDDVEKDDKDGDSDDEGGDHISDIQDANDEGDDHISDTQDADDEDVKTELDEDDIYKYMICVHKDEDIEMKNAKFEESYKGDE
uniref:Uncharacterized protein n=1 Tax=Tanacetum cinerariifolium TaxID=118510 RepID=A0A699GW83_TANCI|nr:hypothetical protein [Tanacetum cinerariifolium]